MQKNNNFSLSSSKEKVITKTLGEGWKYCMEEVLEHGRFVRDEDEMLLEVLCLSLSIETVDDSDSILLRYADPERIKLMHKKYATCDIVANYKISYGKLLYDYDGINQIDWVINKLKNKSTTKSATIAFHPPGKDVLSCLSMLDFKLRSSTLLMNAIYRSQNIWSSQPGNILSLRKIQNHIANSLGVKPGILSLFVMSAHIYEKDIQIAKSTVSLIEEDRINAIPQECKHEDTVLTEFSL